MASINNKKTRIAFLGTPEFAAKILDFIAKRAEFEVVLVITQPDRPAGRKNKLTPPPVRKIAEKYKFRIHQPENSQELENILIKENVDFLVVVGLGMILTQKSLDTAKIAPINLHASLLPKYRGASPIQEALLQGDKETGISIMKMTAKLDTGPVYFMKKVAILPEDDIESLSEKMAEESGECLSKALIDIEEGNLQAIPQDEGKKSYCHKIEKHHGKIDWQKKTAVEILNMMRAYKTWPAVYTEMNGKKLKILVAKSGNEPLAPGEIKVDGKELKVGTKAGTIILEKVQPEGKSPMAIQDYINGYLKKE